MSLDPPNLVSMCNLCPQVEVFVFVGLNWEDAPPEQFAVGGEDYKVVQHHFLFLCLGEGTGVGEHFYPSRTIKN